jgi:phosphate transport system substrate-binding protein
MFGLLCMASPAWPDDLTVPGTGDGLDVLRSVAAAYSGDSPQALVRIPSSVHSQGGIDALRNGSAVLARIARPLTPSEKAEGLIETPVFRIPSSFLINAAALVHHLTAQQTARIFNGETANWREVGGPDLRIKVVRREERDSTLKVLRATMAGWHDLALTERSRLARTSQEVAEIVSETPGAIGFGPYSRLLESNLIVPKIDGRDPMDGSYPSSVTLSFVHRADTVTQPAHAFALFLFSPQAQNYIRVFGGSPLPGNGLRSAETGL